MNQCHINTKVEIFYLYVSYVYLSTLYCHLLRICSTYIFYSHLLSSAGRVSTMFLFLFISGGHVSTMFSFLLLLFNRFLLKYRLFSLYIARWVSISYTLIIYNTIYVTSIRIASSFFYGALVYLRFIIDSQRRSTPSLRAIQWACLCRLERRCVCVLLGISASHPATTRLLAIFIK